MKIQINDIHLRFNQQTFKNHIISELNEIIFSVNILIYNGLCLGYILKNMYYFWK